MTIVFAVGTSMPTLHNGRAQQNVEAAVIEVEHDLFEFALGHLAMADTNPGFGDKVGQPFADPADVLDAIVNEDTPDRHV